MNSGLIWSGGGLADRLVLQKGAKPSNGVEAIGAEQITWWCNVPQWAAFEEHYTLEWFMSNSELEFDGFDSADCFLSMLSIVSREINEEAGRLMMASIVQRFPNRELYDAAFCLEVHFPGSLARLGFDGAYGAKFLEDMASDVGVEFF
jgi:hypothetical protein